MDLKAASVLVTGADGFIGSHLADRLLDEAASVRAFCLYSSEGRAGWLDDLVPSRRRQIDVRLGDVRDRDVVEAATRDIDVVFHLAALIAIPYSYDAPQSFIETNVLGTLNVLNAVRTSDCSLMVNTSTSEVYGTPASLPITLEHPLKAQSPYSASKIAADKLCESFSCAFGTPVVTLRPFNTFGPRQSSRAVIPTILRQLLAGASVVRLGNITPRRDFTYVDDTVEGFLMAARSDLTLGTVVQLGTGEAVSIAELFDLCARVAGVEAVIESDPVRARVPQSEVEVLQSDNSRAQELGWKPTVSLKEGLRRTAEWLRDHPVLDAGAYQR